MARIISCDGGCGAQSPNPFTGLHEANHWLQVRAVKALRFDQANEYDDKLFCEDCAPRVRESLTPTQGPRP